MDDNIHYGLVITGFLLAVVTFLAQSRKPAPYGKHDQKNANWGPMIPQGVARLVSDTFPALIFILVFILFGRHKPWTTVNVAFLLLFEAHYVQRVFVHPKRSNPKVPVGITLGGLIPNSFYHILNAIHISSVHYSSIYMQDTKFLLGLSLYITGFVINRWADWKLRQLRPLQVDKRGHCDVSGYHGYYIPHGGLFELVSCPNYFGESIQWLGWAVSTWSIEGLVWWLFGLATFVPRAWHNHKWYRKQFKDYPISRKALIPFVY